MLFTLNVMGRVKTGISLFRFPKDNTEKRRWKENLKEHYFNVWEERSRWQFQSLLWVQKAFNICEHQYKAAEIRVSLGIGGKTLKPGVIPSIFNFKNPSKIRPRKWSKKRCLPATDESTENDPCLETSNSIDFLPVTILKQILIVKKCLKRRWTI